MPGGATANAAGVLAFDLGGTWLRAGWLCAAERRLTAVARISSDTIRAGGEPRLALEAALQELAEQVTAASPSAVAMAVPGPVQDGVAGRLPSLLGPSYEGGLDFEALGRRLWPGKPVRAVNDLTAAGARYVDQGYQDFGVLTLGSGVGGKLFIDGRPLLGRAGYGGEIGHWRVPGAPPIACDCGGIGHLSALASGRGMRRLARWRADQDPAAFLGSMAAEGGALTSEAVTRAFHAGDRWAGETMEIAAQALGAALAACSLAAGLELFFLTGGFAMAAGETFRARAARAASEHAWSVGEDWDTMVRLAADGEETGLLGAGLLGATLVETTGAVEK